MKWIGKFKFFGFQILLLIFYLFFVEQNRELFELYSKCIDSADVVRVQAEWIAKVEKEHEKKGF